MPRLTIDLPSEINTRLADIAKKQGITKAEAMRKAFALLVIASDEKAKGNSLGVVREHPETQQLQAVARVVGV